MCDGTGERAQVPFRLNPQIACRAGVACHAFLRIRLTSLDG
jgi:hypothetical protein